MNLSRKLAGLLSSSPSQAGGWHHLLRSATALQSSSLSTAAAAKSSPKKSTRAARDQSLAPDASRDPAAPEEKVEHGASPALAPAKTEEETPRLPRPSAIPWQPTAANSVKLIGHLGAPVHLGASPDGAYTAVSVLVNEKTHDIPDFWIPIVFQGDLAQIAACHFKEKDHVYVTGQLTGGSQLINNDAETKMQMMVHSISYILEVHPEKKNDKNNKGPHSTSTNAKKFGESMVGYWNDLLENRQQWQDNREEKRTGKVSPKFPDFKHKGTQQGLWLESAPDWVLLKLENAVDSAKACGQSESERKSTVLAKKANAKKFGESMVGYWNDLLENRQQWRDNREEKRTGKVSPKFPDFSHKGTRQGLWLNSAPVWVLPKLELAVDSAKAYGQSESKRKSTVLAQKEGFWKDLLENPDKWWDKRSKKSKPNAPDFKHKETGEGLWLNSTTTPKWALDKLSPANA